MKVVDVKNLSFSYGSEKVIDNLSFSLAEGHILGLLGPNGSGKSTLINILNGYLVPQQGEARLFGELSTHLSKNNKQQIAYLMEGHVQYNFMNIFQAEKFYRRFYPQWKSNILHDYIDRAKIDKTKTIGNLSYGQRSQVALALLMAQDAKLLILDDFSMGLDPIYRRLFVTQLRTYAQAHNKTVLITSHIIQDIDSLIDDILIMGSEKYKQNMSMDEFKNKNKQIGASLEDIFINIFTSVYD